MIRWLRTFSLPLLSKELIELSARRRTWIVRAVSVGLLMLFVLWACSYLWSREGPEILGSGREIFDLTIGWLFFGIYTLVPLSSFGLITTEKERDTLSILLLTRLTPGTIVVEKLLSRLWPASLFLFSSLPLMSVAYAIGGVSPEMIFNALWTLLVTACSCASIALACSAVSKTSVQSFYGVIAAGLLICFGPLILQGLVRELTGINLLGIYSLKHDALFFLMGPYIYFENSNSPVLDSVVRSLPLIILSCLSLIVAQRFVATRFSNDQPTIFQRAIKTTDRWLARAPRRADGTTTPDERDLPGDQPIAWLERRQQTRRRTRVIALRLLEVLFLGAAFYAWLDRGLDDFALISLCIFWPVAVLLVLGKASGLFGVERSRQTLDVLLTTPLRSEELLNEKMAGVRLLTRALLLRFLGLAVLVAVGRSNAWGAERGQSSVIAVGGVVATAAVYLPMLGWLGMLFGLRAKTAARALVQSVVAVVVWCVGPITLVGCCLAVSNSGFGGNEAFFLGFMGPLLSPLVMPIFSISSFFEWGPFNASFLFILIWNSIVYSVFLLLFRQACRAHIDEWLNRLSNRS